MIALFIIYLFSILSFCIHLFFEKKFTRFRIIELALLYQLIFSVGMASLLAFIEFLFFPVAIAEKLGWNACPFQHEMANASLGYAVIGVLAIWLRRHFWTAIVMGRAIWLISDGIGHLYHAFVIRNFMEGNGEVLLYSDFIVPTVLLVLLFFYLKWQPESREER